MASPLDMTLDDMVKRNRGGRGRGRGRAQQGRGAGRFSGRGRMPGPVVRGPLSVNYRPSQYSIAKSSRRTRSMPWQHDLFEESLRAAGISGVEIGTKLYVSNLDRGVTNQDIRELFSEIGELKRYAVHYDKSGNPSGSAEVVYVRRSDAFAALKKYNDVLLDGRPMKIEIVGSNSEVPVSARVSVTGVSGRSKRTVFMTPGPGQARSTPAANRGAFLGRRGGMRITRGGGRGRGMGSVQSGGRGRGRGHSGGRGRGRGGKKPVDKTANDLDKELDSYHAEAMNVS